MPALARAKESPMLTRPARSLTTNRIRRAALAALGATLLSLAVAATPAGASSWTGYYDGQDNVGAGPSPFSASLVGLDNTAVGIDMMHANTGGIQNVAVGNEVLELNKTGSYNV